MIYVPTGKKSCHFVVNSSSKRVAHLQGFQGSLLPLLAWEGDCQFIKLVACHSNIHQILSSKSTAINFVFYGQLICGWGFRCTSRVCRSSIPLNSSLEEYTSTIQFKCMTGKCQSLVQRTDGSVRGEKCGKMSKMHEVTSWLAAFLAYMMGCFSICRATSAQYFGRTSLSLNGRVLEFRKDP